ncbi:hypothetical protein K458DRAFT_371769 [Lentithecium fluviatile CBS 122367]|uniref:tRNA/rRNA methyltransferase SpoU type domain-containing protein n=1 Tax=Lentithecium fluviatile CBS 122367 TaxID=1168545 RepID=A0A6G1IT29_9PLEO|nr:hypothetical protein K458DRAFT_371769 [Lentithecium fluviatile CBS 122367]
MAAVLQFMDSNTRAAAFEHIYAKLDKRRSPIDLNTLKICIRLLPPVSGDKSATLPFEYIRLRDLLLHCIPYEPNESEHLYLLAELCVSNAHLADIIFERVTRLAGGAKQNVLSEDRWVDPGFTPPKEVCLHHFQALLRFLRSSYWLPPDSLHYVTPEVLNLLLSCVGIDVFDDDAHDTLSALLSLLNKPEVVVVNDGMLPDDWLSVDRGINASTLSNRIIDDALFVRFEQLPSQYFSGNAAKVYRTWFQWMTHAAKNRIPIKALHTPFYWSILRTGLVTGFADQRKYCLGILRSSLLIPQQPIDLPQMTLDIERRLDFMAQYGKYATLFEIIVLDRYPNQVQACLPDLTTLLGPASLISAHWSTALLSAALNPKVQDGIRKLVGNWYLNHVIKEQGSIHAHMDFLVEGFLPWATQGSLLTGSLVTSRAGTNCIHGAALADAVSKFIITKHTDADGQQVILKVLTFILDTEGKIFAPSVLYLLQGLLKGLEALDLKLGAAEFDLILRVSYLPALPEIGTDLCSTYSAQLSSYVDPHLLSPEDVPGYTAIMARLETLKQGRPADIKDAGSPLSSGKIQNDATSLQEFNNNLEESQYKMVQDENFVYACNELVSILENTGSESTLPSDLLKTLDSLWEEADRQEFPRPVVLALTPAFFHPTCAHACSREYTEGERPNKMDELVTLLSDALIHLQTLTQGRPYILSVLATTIRKACFSNPEIIGILPLGASLLQLMNNPPVPKKEFLFEVAAAQELQRHIPQRDYTAYYGLREWHGYAAFIDLLNRIPDAQLFVAKELMDQLLRPWQAQKAPIPIISKWKNVLQLQAMLLLTEACVNDENANSYLDGFMHALDLEQWPRYRYLLEWNIARIYYRFPAKTDRILVDLAKLDENSPAHIASLIKLGVLCAPFLNSEDFALKLMIRLIPLSASPKVQVRHEAHWSFPTLFELSDERKWTSITENPAFGALNEHVRSLDKFNTPPSSIRTLKLDAVRDYTITNIFQGRYLSVETPELERVAHSDFVQLYQNDTTLLPGPAILTARVPLGPPISSTHLPSPSPESNPKTAHTTESQNPTPTFSQTKSGFDIATLLPASGPPSNQNHRPTPIILIASLIDNPTNLGGLSRIAESFGLAALYISDLAKTAHKDFKATSVTSEKHLPIRELKVAGVPDFVVECKRQGYEVVGIEQTDRSGVLGEGEGTLPRKCVLVLGSERGGISKEVLAVLDRCVEIRTVGVTRSLNVQTAGGIAVYEWWREWGGKA